MHCDHIPVDFHGAIPPDHELRALVRKLFDQLPMARHFEDDYLMTIQLLRDVYNEGRQRGMYEGRD